VTTQPRDDQQLFLPSDIGSGWVRHLMVRPGLEVTLMDFSLHRPILIRGGRAPSLIELGFWQMGHDVRYRFDFGEGITQPNQVHLSRIPMSYEGEALYPCNERIMGISLSIMPEVFRGWLTDQPLPQPLHQQLIEAAQVVMFQRQIPAALKLPLSQIRETTWQGAMSRLYIEAKVMEIVALYVQYLTPEIVSDQPHLSHDDIERLHEAKDMLLSRLDNPPSLLELARAVCLNDHKLKAGFKAVFGTTVFGLLYDQRNNRISPTSGYFLRLSNDFAGLGGDVNYLRTRVDGGYYMPFFDEDVVISLSGEAGYIFSTNNDAVRLTDRFYVGGVNLRGFEVAGVGPRDLGTNDSLGGQKYYVGSVQARFPLGLPEELGFSGRAFADFGSLWDVDTTAAGIADESSLRMSAGLGIGWNSPFGPIAIDYAFPIMKEDYDRTERFRVNFGTNF